MERAFAARDPRYDGAFFIGVRTTGIFCRPSCPSRPKPENVEFLPNAAACLEAGYRPCKRCRPTETDGTPPPWVAALMERVAASEGGRVADADLRALGVSPEQARRWFVAHRGMTFAAWCRAHRLAGAFDRIRNGTALDDAGFDAGYGSVSGFREAFRRAFGEPPGRAREGGERMVVAMLESPVGPLLVGALDAGVTALLFADRRVLEGALTGLGGRHRCAVVPGQHRWLAALRRELDEYFAGTRRTFDVPVSPRGTAFQERVWGELRRIEYGTTLSYEALAERVGQPAAVRAVARANAQNDVSILIPCHRVIGKDGELTGYGGGVWRKRLLLELERTGRLPA